MASFVSWGDDEEDKGLFSFKYDKEDFGHGNKNRILQHRGCSSGFKESEQNNSKGREPDYFPEIEDREEKYCEERGYFFNRTFMGFEWGGFAYLFRGRRCCHNCQESGFRRDNWEAGEDIIKGFIVFIKK